MRHQGEHFDAGLSRAMFGGFRGFNISSKVWDCHDLQRKQIKINFIQTKYADRYKYASTVPAKPGNPASVFILLVCITCLSC